MSRLNPKINVARQIVARSAADASAVLSLCAKSEWLASAAQVRPNIEGSELAKLAVSLYLAYEQYVQNGIALREMRAGDRDYRSSLRQSIKLLKEAEKTAGLFANAIASIRAGMTTEVAKPPLFDEETLRGKSGSNLGADAQAKAAAASLLEQFCPKKSVKDSEQARVIRQQADELLRAIGFEVKQKEQSSKKR